MPSWALTVVRWTAAVVGMVLVVVVAVPMAIDQLQQAVVVGDDEEEATDTRPAGPPPVDTGVEAAVAVAGVRNAVLREIGDDVILLSPDASDEMLMAFPILPPDPACLTSVGLEVGLVESVETDLFVRPASVSALPERENGESLPPDAFVDITTPAGAFTSGAPGRLQWDVTDAYALAVRSSADGETVALRVGVPPDEDPERFTALHSGANVEEQRPTLAWTAVAGCDELGVEPPDNDEPEQET